MRPRCSLYVDVGYLLTSAAVRVTGTSLRNGVHVDYEPLIHRLVEQAEKVSGLSMLRVHWYDSARDGVPDARQQRIGEQPRVKLRLGRFGIDGQQKGVDLRIGLDLVTHARNGIADVFILVSGDDDLTEAVEEAQVHGVQVILLAVPTTDNTPHGISRHLVRAADALEMLTPEAIDQTVMKVEVAPATPAPAPQVPPRVTPRDLAGLVRPAPPEAQRPPTSVLAHTSVTTGDSAELAEQIDVVVANVLTAFRQSASAEALAELEAGKPSIPRDIDKALLTDLSNHRGEFDLSEQVRHRLRAQFWKQYDEA